MATSQELLQALTNMQQNAQSNLPVIPNNGNPRGANNMPSMDGNEAAGRGPMQRPQQGGHFYPWMNPSPSVDIIQQLLAGTGGGAQVMPAATPANVNTGGGLPPVNTGVVPPVMPNGGQASQQNDLRFRTILPRAMMR